MLLKKYAIRKLFKAANQRMPNKLVASLDRLVLVAIENSIASGTVTTNDIIQIAKQNGNHIFSRHISEALGELEKEGLIDKGMLISRAKEIAERRS